MQTKIYNKVVSQFETRKGFGKASEAIWQTMPIAPTSIPVRRASRCYNDAVPKQGFYVRVWRRRSFDHNSWGATPLLQRRRSVCSLTAYEGMHSFCELDSRLLLADWPQMKIYMAWGARMQTGKIHGVVASLKKLWRNRRRPTMSHRMDGWEFGLCRCPIFVAKTLEVDLEEVVLSKLRCHT